MEVVLLNIFTIQVDDALRKKVSWSLVILAYVLVIFTILFTQVAMELVHEDGPVEWLQFILFAAAGIVWIITAFHYRSSRKQFIFTLFLCMVCIFLAGEEISWGQRIFAIDTPVPFVENNYQNEMNLHNMEFLGYKDLSYLAFGVFFLTLGVLLPLAKAISQKISNFLDNVCLPVVNIAYVPCFLAVFSITASNSTMLYQILLPLMVGIPFLVLYFAHKREGQVLFESKLLFLSPVILAMAVLIANQFILDAGLPWGTWEYRELILATTMFIYSVDEFMSKNI